MGVVQNQPTTTTRADLDDPCQPKVGNLHDAVITDENVASGEVSVDVVLRLEVRHAGGDLRRDVHQRRQLHRPTLACGA